METRFECRCCGHCCEGRGGIVVSPADLERLCLYLDMSGAEFTDTYGEERNGKLHIRANENGICCFFKPEAGCAVHAAKPDICRAWPYFRGNLIDESSLELAKDFCPGIPKNISLNDFAVQGMHYLQENHLVRHGHSKEAGALNVADLLALLGKTDK